MSIVICQINALIKVSLLELYRRKDIAVVLILGAVLLLPLSFVSPFGLSGAGTYFNEIALVMVWLFSIFIALGVSSRVFPYEFEKRTIYPLLAKPVGRGVVIAGRYLGALTAAVSALCLFYAAYVLLCGFKQGIWFSEALLQAFILHIGLLAVVVAIGMMGSLIMTTSANVTISILVVFAMLLFGASLSALAATQNLVAKTVLNIANAIAPHIEFFDMRQRLVHEWPAVSWLVCAAVMGYAAVYSTVCLFIADFFLKRRRF
ncbi:MAG: ABC transporter permease subunit [Kiritimatiellae bacterium]|jgi:Cu-processing system permease protein|nr:ABC transporter permease subunit [Kiritimatiellia bacterium]